jgi:hypothetical protein
MLMVCGLTNLPVCRAQNDPQAPSASKDSATQPPDKEVMFGIMPSYGVVNEGMHPPPLRIRQKFRLASQYISLYTFVWVAGEAGINQAWDSPHEYGQGAEGYANRFGAAFVDGLTNSFFATGVYPSLLRQDPRYYRRGTGSFANRTWYAATRVLVTRQDSGRKAFNFSEILGNLTSASIGVMYYPASQRGFSHVVERGSIRLGFDAGFDVLKEFYPDIARKLFSGKNKH